MTTMASVVVLVLLVILVLLMAAQMASGIQASKGSGDTIVRTSVGAAVGACSIVGATVLIFLLLFLLVANGVLKNIGTDGTSNETSNGSHATTTHLVSSKRTSGTTK